MSGPRGGRRSPGPATARSVALEVLTAVRERDAYANLALPALLRERSLSPRDAALATELAYGTLRMRGLLDAVIVLTAGRPVSRIDDVALDLLRLGAHQLLHLRVPAHAAVSETVALARAVTHKGIVGFVNAVLRRVGEHDRDTWNRRVTEGLDPVDALAVEHSHPRWEVEALGAALTADGRPDDLVAALAADNEPAAVVVAVRGPGAGQAGMELEEAGATRRPLSPTAWQLPRHVDPGTLDSVAAGSVAVQDEGSQLVALALAHAPLEGRDEQWLDLCAGPGGKAGLLAAAAGERGACLEAVEVATHRAGLVRQALGSFGSLASVRQGDGRTLGDEAPQRFDRILLDAPCSGLGALRRRPEARWRRRPADLADLIKLQRELLMSAARALRPGGVLAYVTCSPHTAETREQVAWLQAHDRAWDVLDAAAVLGQVAGIDRLGATAPGGAQLWPHVHDTDAMFLALLRRR